VSRTEDRYSWDRPTPPRRTTPRKRRPNVAKRARLAEIEANAVPGRNIVTNGRGTCHWCGFHIGPSGHPNCPDP